MQDIIYHTEHAGYHTEHAGSALRCRVRCTELSPTFGKTMAKTLFDLPILQDAPFRGECGTIWCAIFLATTESHPAAPCTRVPRHLAIMFERHLVIVLWCFSLYIPSLTLAPGATVVQQISRCDLGHLISSSGVTFVGPNPSLDIRLLGQCPEGNAASSSSGDASTYSGNASLQPAQRQGAQKVRGR